MHAQVQWSQHLSCCGYFKNSSFQTQQMGATQLIECFGTDLRIWKQRNVLFSRKMIIPNKNVIKIRLDRTLCCKFLDSSKGLCETRLDPVCCPADRTPCSFSQCDLQQSLLFSAIHWFPSCCLHTFFSVFLFGVCSAQIWGGPSPSRYDSLRPQRIADWQVRKPHAADASRRGTKSTKVSMGESLTRS